MTQFILYLVFVNALMTAKIGTIVYLWLTKWSVKSGEELVYDTDLTGEESWDKYLQYTVWTFASASVLLPIFGLVSDKFSAGSELMVTFGLRGVACLAFFMLDSPHGNLV